MIGIHPEELAWMRLLVSLLRHADPRVPELTRQALLYVAETSGHCGFDPAGAPLPRAAGDDRRCSGDPPA
jgi:hypothetical protein